MHNQLINQYIRLLTYHSPTKQRIFKINIHISKGNFNKFTSLFILLNTDTHATYLLNSKLDIYYSKV